MVPTVKFFSNWEQKEIEAEVLEVRKHTYKLKLDNGRVIVKKRKQVIYA